ncbi:MAG: hypothetical protein LBQ12_07985 [Deltaproteobacteria bacterium]|nr:hypothetical protein [Deltaproteobacteria bacterium]
MPALATALASTVFWHFHAAATFMFPYAWFRAASFAAWLAVTACLARQATMALRLRRPWACGISSAAGARAGLYLSWAPRLELDLGFGWNVFLFSERLFAGAASFPDCLPPGPRLMLGLILADASRESYPFFGAGISGGWLAALWSLASLALVSAAFLAAWRMASQPFSEKSGVWLVRLRLGCRAVAVPEARELLVFAWPRGTGLDRPPGAAPLVPGAGRPGGRDCGGPGGDGGKRAARLPDSGEEHGADGGEGPGGRLAASPAGGSAVGGAGTGGAVGTFGGADGVCGTCGYPVQPTGASAGPEGWLGSLLDAMRSGDLKYPALAPVVDSRSVPCLAVELWASADAEDASATVWLTGAKVNCIPTAPTPAPYGKPSMIPSENHSENPSEKLSENPSEDASEKYSAKRSSELIAEGVRIPRDLALFIACGIAWARLPRGPRRPSFPYSKRADGGPIQGAASRRTL